MTGVDYAVAVPTFTGSVMSTIASSLVLLSYATSSRKRHFRHWLILNLTIAGGNFLIFSAPTKLTSRPLAFLTRLYQCTE
ncbi:hypothetical protein BDV38DRAFT_236492 [Aspergillus pseudotamarii]|uniref:Glucose receptor Git3 N-terminal domain-containing protein n=1 Tax=Aspergillus pseudotamarii TaxID=132259 RepID=A0A5N6T654_ASPPS|nr:uncharacterized protein BDV38DRAFT_236492 [Aspergillus pseudotamarii]KAE8141804.1 hypothetical protein BDV38DRAFT_236492 [Aspergillus pseudotamarii]